MREELELKKLQKDRLVAEANLLQKEIRIMELHDEIERNKAGIESQKKVMQDIKVKVDEIKAAAAAAKEQTSKEE